MKYFHSEFAHDYATYSFGYTLHAALGTGDAASDAYENGFLPYSANPSAYNLLYMARSVRVPAASFSPTSENRRVLENLTGRSRAALWVAMSSRTTARSISYFCGTILLARHGKKVMGEERLQGILKTELPLRGVRYETSEGELIAAVFEPAESHWAHSRFRRTIPGTSAPPWGCGSCSTACAAQQPKDGRIFTSEPRTGRRLATSCNIEGLEFWDGTDWIADDAKLKERMREDGERIAVIPSRFSL